MCPKLRLIIAGGVIAGVLAVAHAADGVSAAADIERHPVDEKHRRLLLPWDDDNPVYTNGSMNSCPPFMTGCCGDIDTCSQRKWMRMSADAYARITPTRNETCEMPYIIPKSSDNVSLTDDGRKCITRSLSSNGTFAGEDRVLVCKDGETGNNLDGEDGRFCHVAFHGVDDVSDWVTLVLGSSDYEPWLDKYEVLQGFHEEYMGIGALAMEALRAVGCLVNETVSSGLAAGLKGIHIIGHSLGGAMAQMSYVDIKENYKDVKVRVTTYGSAKAFKTGSAPDVHEGDRVMHFYTGAVHRSKAWWWSLVNLYRFKQDIVRNLQPAEPELLAQNETYLLCHYDDSVEQAEYNFVYKDATGDCLDHHIPPKSSWHWHQPGFDSWNLHFLRWYDYILDKSDEFGC